MRFPSSSHVVVWGRREAMVRVLHHERPGGRSRRLVLRHLLDVSQSARRVGHHSIAQVNKLRARHFVSLCRWSSTAVPRRLVFFSRSRRGVRALHTSFPWWASKRRSRRGHGVRASMRLGVYICSDHGRRHRLLPEFRWKSEREKKKERRASALLTQLSARPTKLRDAATNPSAIFTCKRASSCVD